MGNNQNNEKMKFWSIVLLTINSIIGTGIFLSPGAVAKLVGSKAAMIYLAAAAFAAVLAVTFAAASKYVIKSGAAYAYSKAAFGDEVSSYVGITRVVSASIAWGVMATGVVKTTLSIFGKDSSDIKTVTIGFITLMLILLIINLIGTKLLTLISNISTIGKVGALTITIIAGICILIFSGGSHIEEMNLLKDTDGNNLIPTFTTSVFVTALIGAFYAFTGFESVASGSADMEEPEKNLPRAIPLAIIIIACIYFGIVFVSMYIDPVAMVTSKEPVVLASIFKNQLLQKIIIIGALMSMFGINVAASFHTPRVFEAMANEKQIPEFFARRTKGGLPLTSFLLTAIIAVVIPLAFNYNMSGIIIISSISRFIQFIIVPLAVISFFYGKNKEEVLQANKSFMMDVIVPIIALLLTVLLLVKFNWAQQFSTKLDDGTTTLNIKAVVSMLIGYVILPICLRIYMRGKK
ncbi:APC family permease [Fusobacterium periodonticum]|uniref:Amino acid permease n=1 Tax=Fusobacterium periodonticum ATCC 33693 TaxID=546275 RepID=D4CSV2_9FUSO|nr:APC family permease [Fusobacterium periodonticum]EFE87573.1 amino acid permease [Fusobacterium periodonticum ATCC 33693]